MQLENFNPQDGAIAGDLTSDYCLIVTESGEVVGGGKRTSGARKHRKVPLKGQIEPGQVFIRYVPQAEYVEAVRRSEAHRRRILIWWGGGASPVWHLQ